MSYQPRPVRGPLKQKQEAQKSGNPTAGQVGADGKYYAGYVNVPGKGTRYQTDDGRLFNNHFGPTLNQLGDAARGVRSILPGGQRYTEYYNNVADAVGTERVDGTVAPKPSKDSQSSSTPDVPVRPSQPTGWTTGETQLDALLGKDSPGAGGNGGSGGSDTRVNENGVVQTGTNTGFKPMTLAGLEGEKGILGSLGLKIADPYSSNQLPTT